MLSKSGKGMKYDQKKKRKKSPNNKLKFERYQFLGN